MELHEIRYFLALSRTLNFTRASEQCNVTQPALTRAIQKMEHELGGLLFSRERNNIHLTDLGRLLEPQFADMLGKAEDAKLMASRFLRLQDAPMTVGVMCTIGPLRFVDFLNRFRVAHPGVELSVVEAVPARLGEMLMRGELDVAVMSRPDGFEAPLQAIPLYRERFMVACAQSHGFAACNVVRMRDLDGEIYLQRINCEYRDVLAECLAERGAAIERSYRSEREDWIQTMVAAGMGICFLPEFSVTLPGLVMRPVVEPAVTREVSLVTVGGRRWSSPAAAFMKAIRRHEWPAGVMVDSDGYADVEPVAT